MNKTKPSRKAKPKTKKTEKDMFAKMFSATRRTRGDEELGFRCMSALADSYNRRIDEIAEKVRKGKSVEDAIKETMGEKKAGAVDRAVPHKRKNRS